MSLQGGQAGPEARRVRFHPPETNRFGEARARIRFDIGGRPAGELKEFPRAGGSRWVVSSVEARLSGIGIPREMGVYPEALTLGRACRLVEREAAGGATLVDGPLGREEGRRRRAEEYPPESPVRFRAPAYDREGWVEIGVEVDGRFCGRLREVPAGREVGSQWIMYSRHPELDRIGTFEPGGLGKACRDVARQAEYCRARLAAGPERGPEPER